jgi:hypothetical protein
MDNKQIRWCSVYPNRSQIPTVMAMSITADSLLPRPKLDSDVGYDATVKGASVVVPQEASMCSFPLRFTFIFMQFTFLILAC